jgi:guanylate kinase
MGETTLKKIIVITAPSGAGKTTITRHLMQCFPELSFSVSATTRAPRQNETDGKDYHFISTEAFENKIKEEAFIEWEMVYEGIYYGTLKSEINTIWKRREVAVLDIDVKGAMNIKKNFPAETLTLFIAPPSINTLRERLQERGTETPASIEKRIQKANEEISYKNRFDYIILNDDLKKACEEAVKITAAFLQKTNPVDIDSV